MTGELEGMQGAATDVAGLSQVEPGKPVSPLRASIPSADDVLNTRLKAAGMYSIPEMMGVTPLTRWTVQVGMTDLDTFAAWLDRRVSQFLRMKAGYELGDKDKSDELYEWVNAHSAAFSEVRENFRAVREAMAAQGGEARRAETGTGSVHEHPVPEGQAPNPTPTPQTGEGKR